MFSSSDTDEEPNDEDDDEEGGDQIDVETVEPYRDSDSESEPEQLRRVSDFELLYGSDKEVSTALAALVFLYGRGRGHAVVWAGRIEDDSSSDDDMPYNWASGRGRTRRRAAPSVIATANLPGWARGRGRARTTGSSQPEVGPSS